MKPEMIYPELELPDLFVDQKRFHRISRPTKVPSRGYSDSQIRFLQETADGLLTQIKKIQEGKGMDGDRSEDKPSTREPREEGHAHSNLTPKEMDRDPDHPSARETTSSPSTKTGSFRSSRPKPTSRTKRVGTTKLPSSIQEQLDSKYWNFLKNLFSNQRATTPPQINLLDKPEPVKSN